jgi:hypothetical protein
MDVNEELDEQTADRLLAGELGPDEVAPGYRQVASLLSATRAEPSTAELAHQADTVQAMAAARRGGGEGSNPSPASWATRLARRRNVRLGAVAAATALSLTTGLAAAGVLPGPLQSVASDVLPFVGDSGSDSDGQGAAERPPGPPDPGPGAGPGADPAQGGGAVSGSPAPPPKVEGPGSPAASKTPPGQAKQAAKAVLRADATTSGGHLVVSFQETGAGSDAVTVTARADATATYGCVNPNGKNDRTRKEASVAGVSQAQSRFSAGNGDARGALTLTPPAPTGVSCPSGESPQLLRVLYSGIVVLDTTTGASTTINRTFPATP